MRSSARALFVLMALVLGGASACTTDDDLGYDDPTAHPLSPLGGPASYPNLFRQDLGKSDTDVDRKVKGAYAKLFHGDPDQTILVTVGDDQAYIRDTLHLDIRTEGLGLGMLLAVELGERDDFDKLWAYTSTNQVIASGPAAGYFKSSCDTLQGGPVSCLDPYGLQQFVTALIFAHDRWGRPAGDGHYELAAQKLIAVMRLKERLNGGRLQGISNAFDRGTHLVFGFSDGNGAPETRTSIVLPAYYGLWRQATGDPFWDRAALAGRAYWSRVAHPRTGLLPTRATFDGTPLAGWGDYLAENYRTQINVALDVLWGGPREWGVAENEKLLAFFVSQGVQSYGRSYSVDGTVELDGAHDASLVAANGAAAAIASRPSLRKDFVQAVWDADMPTGTLRYYPGLLQMVALLVLSGQMRVW